MAGNAARSKSKTHKVVRSIHDYDVRFCVDILRGPDGSLTYREFRRDAEDGNGWFMTNDFCHRNFPDEATLLADARKEVPWLIAYL